MNGYEYTTITNRRALNFSVRGGNEVKHIVVHGTECSEQCDEECNVVYLIDNERAVSAHELVVGRNVYKMVDYDKAAHTVAFSRLPDGATGWLANARTYNLEGRKVVGRPMDVDTKTTMMHRVAELAREEGWSPEIVRTTSRVLFHRNIDTQGKTCPGLDWDLQGFRNDVARIMESDKEFYQKLCWGIESSADRLRNEGFVRAADALLGSPCYTEWKLLRDN
jgi:hypothetical protein